MENIRVMIYIYGLLRMSSLVLLILSILSIRKNYNEITQNSGVDLFAPFLDLLVQFVILIIMNYFSLM